jgi:hypothetical protein
MWHCSQLTPNSGWLNEKNNGLRTKRLLIQTNAPFPMAGAEMGVYGGHCILYRVLSILYSHRQGPSDVRPHTPAHRVNTPCSTPGHFQRRDLVHPWRQLFTNAPNAQAFLPPARCAEAWPDSQRTRRRSETCKVFRERVRLSCRAMSYI